MYYCSLQHWTLVSSPVTSQLGIVFTLVPSLHSFWSYFSTDLQQYIGHLPTWGVHLSVFIFLPFHTVHGVLKARILKQFAFPFSSGPCFVRTLHHDPSVLGHPCRATHLSLTDLSYTCLKEELSAVFCEKKSD